MKIKVKHSDEGVMEILREAEELESRSVESLDFSDEIHSLSMAERRALIASFEVKTKREREQAFDIFLRHGKDALTDEQRAQASGTDASGGYLTPASFASSLADSLQQHDELFEVATLIETEKGTAFNYPIDDDTQATATIVSENSQSLTNSPATFANVAFNRCPMWRSGHIIASMELANDSAFPLSTVLAMLFGRRFARGCGAQFITNLLADADAGVTAAAQSTVTADEILDLIASVDAAYSISGVFLMRTATLTSLQKLKASTGGSYQIDFDRDVNGRTTLFGYPVYISPSMPALGAGNKSIAFGDLSRFVRRQVRNSLSVKMYSEKYATSGQVGWEGFLRVDGKLAKAASSPLPIRLLQCHA